MMEALVLDGKILAKQNEEALSGRVAAIKQNMDGRAPVLATILVGDDPASATYVKMKGNACRRDDRAWGYWLEPGHRPVPFKN